MQFQEVLFAIILKFSMARTACFQSTSSYLDVPLIQLRSSMDCCASLEKSTTHGEIPNCRGVKVKGSDGHNFLSHWLQLMGVE